MHLVDHINTVGAMKKIYLLGVVPPVFNLAGALFSRNAGPYVLGMPPMLAWVVTGVLVTSIVMQVIYRVDKRSSLRAGAAEPACKETL